MLAAMVVKRIEISIVSPPFVTIWRSVTAQVYNNIFTLEMKNFLAKSNEILYI